MTLELESWLAGAYGEIWEENDWSFDACRRRLKKATAIVIHYSGEYEKVSRRAADAEAVYRSEVGKVFAKHRANGEAVEAAKIAAHRECAKFSHERDFSRDLVRRASDDLQGALDSRRSLWRLVEWARGRDLATAPTVKDEREPAEAWP